MGTIKASDVTFPPRSVEKTDERVGGSSAPSTSFAPQPLPPAANSNADEYDDGGVYTAAPTVNPVVTALQHAQLYITSLSDGRHSVCCPWAAEHAVGATSEASYVEPDRTHPIGRFSCSQSHANGQGIGRLLEHLGLTDAAARGKPRIRVMAGETHRAAEAAERELAADGSYFSAGGPIVRIVLDAAGNPRSELLNEQSLAIILADKIDWEKQFRGRGWERLDPPTSVVKMVLRAQSREHLPLLTGIARQPFWREDGSLVTDGGYDGESGIYASFQTSKFSLEAPTRDAAESALHYLKWLIRGSYFASDSDRSAAICAMLTAAARTSLPLAPAFSISASRSGSGKSYLAKLIARFAGSDEPSNVSYPATAEEASKVVLAMLLERPAVVLFDDMQGNWKPHGALNKALTSATITERVLGNTRTATARTNVLFLGTGNNVEPDRDMRRRVVSIYLAPPGETPALLSYEGDPLAQLNTARERAVSAALTIIAAYRAAGRPVADVPNIGTYEDWSAMCRQPLLWLGEPDPATSLINQVTSDPDQDLLANLFRAWTDRFGTSPVTVRKLLKKSLDDENLEDALFELPVMEGKHVNPGRFGYFLKKNVGRVAGGYMVQHAECSDRKAWQVIAADS